MQKTLLFLEEEEQASSQGLGLLTARWLTSLRETVHLYIKGKELCGERQSRASGSLPQGHGCGCCAILHSSQPLVPSTDWLK